MKLPIGTRFPTMHILMPHYKDRGYATPIIEGHQHITLRRVKVAGKWYDKFEYIPEFIKLCGKNKNHNARWVNRNREVELTKEVRITNKQLLTILR